MTITTSIELRPNQRDKYDAVDQGDETKVSVRIDEEFKDDFDEAMFQAKIAGDLPRDYNRSDGLRLLMRSYIELYLRDGSGKEPGTENQSGSTT